jgi:hypothetical protein
MKQSEDARKIVSDPHVDEVQAQIRRIQEQAEMMKPRSSDESEMTSGRLS